VADIRTRVLEAALDCVGRNGFARTTVEEVARASGVSRATVYRHFPGGRDQIVSDVISWEAGRFFLGLTAEVAGATGLAQVLEEALTYAHRALADHQVFQKVLATEPEVLLPQLTLETARLVGFVRAFLLPYVAAAPLRDGVGAEDAADLLARLVLSYIGSPGQRDLSDRAQLSRLVTEDLLSAILA